MQVNACQCTYPNHNLISYIIRIFWDSGGRGWARSIRCSWWPQWLFPSGLGYRSTSAHTSAESIWFASSSQGCPPSAGSTLTCSAFSYRFRWGAFASLVIWGQRTSSLSSAFGGYPRRTSPRYPAQPSTSQVCPPCRAMASPSLMSRQPTGRGPLFHTMPYWWLHYSFCRRGIWDAPWCTTQSKWTHHNSWRWSWPFSILMTHTRSSYWWSHWDQWHECLKGRTLISCRWVTSGSRRGFQLMLLLRLGHSSHGK